jgi:hypothetical protein
LGSGRRPEAPLTNPHPEVVSLTAGHVSLRVLDKGRWRSKSLANEYTTQDPRLEPCGPEVPHDRPHTLGDCQAQGLGLPEHPCPYVGCSHHLYLDLNEATGTLTLNFPDREPDELEQTCSLRVADKGEHTLEETGDMLQLTRERVRQIEGMALRNLRWLTEVQAHRH